MEFMLWLSKFGPTSLADLKEAIELFQKVMKTEDEVERIRLILAILKIAARLSPTTIDDTILETIDKFASPEMIDKLLDLVGRLTGSRVRSLSAEEQTEEAQYFNAQGIGLLQAIALAKMIADVLKTIRQIRS